MTYLFVGHMMQKSVQESVAKRYPKIDLAFLPVNDLRIKINFNEQKAFGPEDAANLCMLLRPRTAVPVHYNFEGSWLSNTFLLRQNGTPEKFKQKIQEKKINTDVQILETGNWLSLK